jgi:hypothetical protein
MAHPGLLSSRVFAGQLERMCSIAHRPPQPQVPKRRANIENRATFAGDPAKDLMAAVAGMERIRFSTYPLVLGFVEVTEPDLPTALSGSAVKWSGVHKYTADWLWTGEAFLVNRVVIEIVAEDDP